MNGSATRLATSAMVFGFAMWALAIGQAHAQAPLGKLHDDGKADLLVPVQGNVGATFRPPPLGGATAPQGNATRPPQGHTTRIPPGHIINVTGGRRAPPRCRTYRYTTVFGGDYANSLMRRIAAGHARGWFSPCRGIPRTFAGNVRYDIYCRYCGSRRR